MQIFHQKKRTISISNATEACSGLRFLLDFLMKYYIHMTCLENPINQILELPEQSLTKIRNQCTPLAESMNMYE